MISLTGRNEAPSNAAASRAQILRTRRLGGYSNLDDKSRCDRCVSQDYYIRTQRTRPSTPKRNVGRLYCISVAVVVSRMALSANERKAKRRLSMHRDVGSKRGMPSVSNGRTSF